MEYTGSSIERVTKSKMAREVEKKKIEKWWNMFLPHESCHITAAFFECVFAKSTVGNRKMILSESISYDLSHFFHTIYEVGHT